MKKNNSGKCIWWRQGFVWPHNKSNHWKTSCGVVDHGKLAKGLCPHCARVVEPKAIEGDGS